MKTLSLETARSILVDNRDVDLLVLVSYKGEDVQGWCSQGFIHPENSEPISALDEGIRAIAFLSRNSVSLLLRENRGS